ncbi:Rrf2 family transcriptional regulator [Roseomonas eburnea]|uniref:Rrf2 family transcriptional regulator n=1 Tax=Neoroseomonas eburnea TaxID=1346889 RepID=A0A9X9XDN2_9PROT|nr:Rrf2 family transcriptional regulator [Neoroseomonas eburnea]MBR0681818.1 Rrf2 family transcriptional regulator [Neoroseomonas eburnea]
MRLLAATDFALRALMRLAAEPERRLSTEVLARELGLSRNHLHKVVQSLSAAGLVRTLRGAQGGVTLALPPERISIGAVVRRMEEGQAIVECFRADGGACSLTPRCRLKGALAGAEAAFYRTLDGITLADCTPAGTLAPF